MLVLTLLIHRKVHTRYNRAQNKFPPTVRILLLQSQYAAITLTTYVPTRTVEKDL